MKRFLAIGLTAIGLAAPANAEHLAPRNQCASLDGMGSFQMALTTAVANRDEEMLKDLVHPQVHLDFGGGSGWEEMRGRLTADPYQLWEQLDAVLRLGCARFDDGSVAMPYYWAQRMPESFGAFDTYIVLGDQVPLYSTEDGQAVRNTLRWEAVKVMPVSATVDGEKYDLFGGAQDAARWKVETVGGTGGYVEREKLRSLVDYRLIASRTDGQWRITTFIAGD